MIVDEGRANVQLFDKSEGMLARVEINNQRKLNAGSPALVKSLKTEFEFLSGNSDLRCVVLTGAGDRAFMAGADLDSLNGLTPETGRAFITELHEAIEAIRNVPVPVIGALRGYCLGAGLELAAACDFRVGDSSFVMGMPEVQVGLPSVIEAALLPNIIGWGKTREMLLTGMNYQSDEAHKMGFLERLVLPAELEAVVEDYVKRIIANGPLAVRSQKALIGKWETLPVDEAILAGIEHFADSYLTDEPRRLIAPLLAKKR